MDGIEAIRTIVEESGLTHRQIAGRLGRYDTYVSQILTRGRDPLVSTLADIARACGYRLDLVPMDGAGATIHIGDDADDDAGAVSISQARALLVRASAMLASLDDTDDDAGMIG